MAKHWKSPWGFNKIIPSSPNEGLAAGHRNRAIDDAAKQKQLNQQNIPQSNPNGSLGPVSALDNNANMTFAQQSAPVMMNSRSSLPPVLSNTTQNINSTVVAGQILEDQYSIGIDNRSRLDMFAVANYSLG